MQADDIADLARLADELEEAGKGTDPYTAKDFYDRARLCRETVRRFHGDAAWVKGREAMGASEAVLARLGVTL